MGFWPLRGSLHQVLLVFGIATKSKHGLAIYFWFWVFTNRILIKKSLDELTQMNFAHWDKEMLYTYVNKFIKFNDIVGILNGFARIIELKTF